MKYLNKSILLFSNTLLEGIIMKKKIILLLSFTLVLISCQNQVIEKEVIKEVSKKIKSGSISIQITQPNDNSTIKLTNDFAPINVKISGPDSISKVAWKKGAEKIGVKPGDFFSDENVHQITLDSSSSASFTVTENGWYDIVAQDVLGRYEWEQVEVRTIDIIPLEEVKNLRATCENKGIKLSWVNPSAQSCYDSPLKSIRFKYIYDNNLSDPNNGEFVVDSESQSTIIQLADAVDENSCLQITAKTIDEVGNESEGQTIQAYCSDTIYATTEDVIEKIRTMTTSGKVVVSGDFWNNYELRENLKNILQENSTVRVDLDFSRAINMKYDFLDFMGCLRLNSIILPNLHEGSNGSQPYNSIKARAFYNCVNLTNAILPENCVLIYSEAFYGCSNLGNIILPDKLYAIEYGAFSNCTSLEKINIPKTVLYIEVNAFFNCTNLSEITFEDTESNWYKSENKLNRNKTTVNDAELIGKMTSTENVRFLTEPYTNSNGSKRTYYLYNENFWSNN